MRLARCRCSNSIIGNLASLQLSILISSVLASSFLFPFNGSGERGVVGRGVGSPIYILKALSLTHYDWIHLSHMFNPEQVTLQGLEQIDYTVLHQALPLLGLGIPPPKPPAVTVGEVPGHFSSKIQALIPGK